MTSLAEVRALWRAQGCYCLDYGQAGRDIADPSFLGLMGADLPLVARGLDCLTNLAMREVAVGRYGGDLCSRWDNEGRGVADFW